jgi:hypothetical protein
VHVDVFVAVRDHVHLDLRYLLVGADQDPEPPPVKARRCAGSAGTRRSRSPIPA